MSITRIKSYGISDGAITTNKISGDVSLGVKIANVQIANSSYSILDDTAVALEGGYLVINGAGFASGCQVIVGANTATSTTFVNSTTIRAQVGAADAGTKTIYVVNTDGGTAIRVNGLTYSATPTWVTGSTLTETAVDEAISIQLDASGATSYQVQTGSTLPTGLSLAANGLLSGTVTGIEDETTYSFTIEAIDDENQESPRSFSITITFGDEYFYATTLLLNGDGANGANNNTFVDSSNNNFAITRNGNTTQGTFSPFSADDGKWSNYFPSNTITVNQKISGTLSSGLGTGNFSFEFFVWWIASPTGADGIFYDGGANGVQIIINVSGQITVGYRNGAGSYAGSFITASAATAVTKNAWTHVQLIRSGTGTNETVLYINGVSAATATVSYDFTSTIANIGGRFAVDGSNWYPIQGYLANYRISNTNRTAGVPTSPLTSDANTLLLTCQSNRFADSSSNNFTLTPNGNVSVTSFAPFAPTAAYSAATNGGSGYFDGSGDWLSAASNAAFDCGTGNWTLEAWVYILSESNAYPIICGNANSSYSTAGSLAFGNHNTDSAIYNNKFIITGRDNDSTGNNLRFADSTTHPLNTWIHIAVVRDSSTTLKMYRDGVLVASTSNIPSGYTFNWGLNGFRIGGGNWDGTNRSEINGYISNFRLIKGQSLTTGAFTPPTAPLQSGVVGWTGANVAASITGTEAIITNFTNAGILDYTRKNSLETVGNAQISTSVKKYGTGAIEFDGTGDYLKGIAANAGMNPQSGDYTVEFWAYISSLPGAEKPIVATMTSGGTGLLIGLAGGGNVNKMQHGIGNLSVVNPTVVDSSNFPTSQWVHVAAVRSSGTIYLYINGTSVGTPTSATGIISQPTLTIGTWPSASTTLNGLIDDLRISSIARYTSNFTPPTSAHKLK
jgi:hypothetical protein